MADLTGAFVQGLLVPDPRITAETYDATLSSVTQAGPRVGIPVDQGASLAVLSASGSQSADGSLDVGILRAGAAPGMKWRTTGDTYWRGWHPPIAITGREFVSYTTIGLSAGGNHHAITLQSGVVLVAYDLAVIAGQHTTRISYLSASDSAPTWTVNVTVFAHDQTLTYASHPSLVQLDSGRVLCFYWVEIQSGGTTTHVRCQMSYSDDDGATWTIGAGSVLGAPLAVAAASFTPSRIRVARSGTQMCMVIGFGSTSTPNNDRLRQYASADLGATWSQVAELDGQKETNSGAFQDLVGLRGGGFALAWLQPTSAFPVTPQVRLFGAASMPMTAAKATTIYVTDLLISTAVGNVRWGTQTGDTLTDGDLALAQDDDGSLYLYGRQLDGSGAGSGVVVVSMDRGANWTVPQSGFGARGFAPWYTGDAAAYPRSFTATMCKGRAVLVGLHAASPGTGDLSVSAIYLGGYTTIPIGSIDAGIGGVPINRTSWSLSWSPYDLPENTGGSWLRTTTGAPAAPSFDGNGDLSTVTGAGDTIEYRTTSTPTGTILEGMIVEAEVKVASGAAEVYCRIGDATGFYEARIAVGTTSIVLRDVVAGANITTATTSAGATGQGVRVRLYVVKDNAIGWYRAVDASHDQAWTLIGQTASLTKNLAAGVHRMRLAVDVSCSAVWRWWGLVSDDLAGLLNVVDADDLVERSCGRALGGPPGTYIDDGVSVALAGGPALTGDEWQIKTAYDYPVTAVDPTVSPSPSRAWRSTGTTAQTIAWSWHVAGTVSYPPGRALGLYLGGANFRTAHFEGLNLAGSWVSLGEWDASDGQSALRYARSGESLYVDTGGVSSSPWFPTDALAGSTFQLDSSTARRILAHSAGTWTAQTTQTPILRLDGVSAADPASGTAGRILSRNALLVVTSVGGVAFRAFRVRIPSGQPTPDGYYTLGVAMLGIIHQWGREYSWGRRIDLAPNTIVTEGRSGVRSVRSLGPPRRAVEIAWPDGIDATSTGGTSPTPDYVTIATGGAPPNATPGGTPWDLLGIVGRLSGDAQPVVYFDGLPISSADTRMISHPTRLLYGRIRSAPSIDQVVGREWGDTAGEVLRIASVRIEEEV